MILEKALKFLESELNAYIKAKFDEQENRVELSDLVSQNGSLSVSPNCIGLTLVNIKEEKIAKTQGMVQSKSAGVSVKKNPDIKIEVYILFSANFGDYGQSLKAISCLLSFFQRNNVFEKSKFPAMDSSSGKLVFEMQTLSFEEQNHIWGTLGAKYIPSLLYKMKVLVIDEDETDAQVYPIKEVQITNSEVL